MSGTLEIQGASSLANNSFVEVNGGKLRFNVTGGSASVGTGALALIGNDAVLELAGSVSALSSGQHGVEVLNDSTATAGILVSGTNQRVGGIDGSGIVQVNAGSDLTADHIIQNAILIGGIAGSPGLVTINASDAKGNPLGQTSGIDLAGSLTPSDPFGGSGVSSANLSSIRNGTDQRTVARQSGCGRQSGHSGAGAIERDPTCPWRIGRRWAGDAEAIIRSC